MKKILFVLVIVLLSALMGACNDGIGSQPQLPSMPTLIPNQVEITTLVGPDKSVTVCSGMNICMTVKTIGSLGHITGVILLDDKGGKIGKSPLSRDGVTHNTGEFVNEGNPSYAGLLLYLTGENVVVTSVNGFWKQK